MNLKTIKLTALCLILVFQLWLVLPVLAQTRVIQISPDTQSTTAEDMDITITPPVAYLKIKPGSIVVHTITITNDSPQDLIVTPTLVDFKADGRTGQPLLQTGHSFPHIENELDAFSPVTLPKDKTAQLSLNIRVPSEAEHKEYPLTILFRSEPAQPSEQNTIVSGVIGSNMIVLISPDNQLPMALKVSDIEIFNLQDSFQDIEFLPIVENDSLGAQQASGSATITDWRGKVVKQFEIYPDVILGGSTRALRAAIPDTTTPDPDLEDQITIQPDVFKYLPKFLLGPYKITINLVQLDQDDQSVDQPISVASSTYSEVFFAFPFGILAVIILVGGLFAITKSVKKIRTTKQEQQPI